MNARSFLKFGLIVALLVGAALIRDWNEPTRPAHPTPRQIAPLPPASESAKTSPAKFLESQFAKDFAELKNVENCYRTDTCNYPQTDPRSYSIAVGHDLAQKTAELHRNYAGDSSAQEGLMELAQLTIRIDDGFVQDAALDLLHDLPISAENLAALGEGLQYNTDPLISSKAILELGRYIGTPQELQMQTIVQDMLHGAHFAAQAAGENILPFINDKSFAAYQQLKNRLPPESRVARNLATALAEYRRQQSGG